MRTVAVLMTIFLVLNCSCANVEKNQAANGKIVRGIAAKYPGDKGIERNKAVLFHDGFENGKPGTGWDHVRGIKYIEAETDPNIARGKQSGRFSIKKDRNSDTTMWKWVEPQHELYMRHYARYGEDFGYQSHGGSGFVATSNHQFGPGGHAGRAPAGDKLFWNALEPTGGRGKYAPPGALNFYAYWWKMKTTLGDRSYGNRFETDPPQIPKLGQWTCIEWRVKVNTAGQDDGELDCWVDGIKCGEFRGINWRSVESLLVNQISLGLYLPSTSYERSGGNETRTVWYDDIVVATEYIGPMTQKGKAGK